MSGQEVTAHLIDRHQRQEEAAMQGFRAPAVTLVESVALAMADCEGNAEVAAQGLGNNYDAIGYRALAAAAVAELRRLKVLPVEGAPVTLADLKVLLASFGRAPDPDSLVVYQRVCEQVADVEGRKVPWKR